MLCLAPPHFCMLICARLSCVGMRLCYALLHSTSLCSTSVSSALLNLALLGLIDDGTWESFLLRTDQKEKEIERLRKTTLAPSEKLNEMLTSRGTAPLTTGCKLDELLRRPQLSYADLAPFDKDRPLLPDSVAEKVETEIKYAGYIVRQAAQVEEMLRLEKQLIPSTINYSDVYGLRLEAVEKLNKVRPTNIGQASRISGVSPADVSVLIIYLEKLRQEKVND